MRVAVAGTSRGCRFIGVETMVPNSRFLRILLLSLLLALGACESALLREQATNIDPIPAPQNAATSDEPTDILREFIEAWNGENFEAMYGLLAGRSRELYPLQRFINQYTEAHSVIRFAA